MRMRPGNESDWHEVCGNCQFFDGSKEHVNCCELYGKSRLSNGSCFNFLYDVDHRGTEYGCDRLSEDYIRGITAGYSDSPDLCLHGESLGYGSDFEVSLNSIGDVELYASGEYGVRLDMKSMKVLKAILEEGLRRKKCD